jgi:predicted AAA+ superfamily ATPase
MMPIYILARQKEEIKEKLSGKIVERDIKKRIEKLIEKDIVKVITGVRRSGKSTLAFLLLKNKKFGYINFDEKELTTQNLDDLLSSIKEIYGKVKYLLLDEIQNVEKWELWVNSLQRRGYNLIITGSNAKLLSKELATHLTGRYLEFENFPFSFREFLEAQDFNLDNIRYLKEKQGEVKNLLRKYLWEGGFPEYLIKKLDESYLITLFNSIIYADIVKRWNVKYPSKLEDLIRYLINIFGREYTATKAKNILDFKSTSTVLNYIKYAEEAYLLFSLERFSFKQKEFFKMPKKVYCIDFGFIKIVSKRVTEDFGRLMENCVFLELRRKGLKENKDLFYFKDSQNHEVDFVVKEGLKVTQVIQVTYASSKDEIENREIRSLLKAAENFKRDKPELLVITWDYESVEDIKGKKIKFLPLWKWLLDMN